MNLYDEHMKELKKSNFRLIYIDMITVDEDGHAEKDGQIFVSVAISSETGLVGCVVTKGDRQGALKKMLEEIHKKMMDKSYVINLPHNSWTEPRSLHLQGGSKI